MTSPVERRIGNPWVSDQCNGRLLTHSFPKPSAAHVDGTRETGAFWKSMPPLSWFRACGQAALAIPRIVNDYAHTGAVTDRTLMVVCTTSVTSSKRQDSRCPQRIRVTSEGVMRTRRIPTTRARASSITPTPITSPSAPLLERKLGPHITTVDAIPHPSTRTPKAPMTSRFVRRERKSYGAPANGCSPDGAGRPMSSSASRRGSLMLTSPSFHSLETNRFF